MQPCFTLATTLLKWKSKAEITYFLLILPIYPSTLVPDNWSNCGKTRTGKTSRLKGGRIHWKYIIWAIYLQIRQVGSNFFCSYFDLKIKWIYHLMPFCIVFTNIIIAYIANWNLSTFWPNLTNFDSEKPTLFCQNWPKIHTLIQILASKKKKTA